jgi:hypothetical protein
MAMSDKDKLVLAEQFRRNARSAANGDRASFWSRTMATPVEPEPEPEVPAYEVPASARTQNQWGQETPTIESLRSNANTTGRREPLVREAPDMTGVDTSTIGGSRTVNPRTNHSSWQPVDYGLGE